MRENHSPVAPVINPISIRGVDYLEIYVGNAHQAMHFYRLLYGFKPCAYAGLETGARASTSVVLEQNNVRLVLTGALVPDSPISKHVKLHGDSVRDIAFRVDDASSAYETAVSRGALSVLAPTVFEDEHGQVIQATVKTFGDCVHSFIQRDAYDGVFLPGYRPYSGLSATLQPHLSRIDHIAVCVERGELARWIEFYEKVLGFHLSHQEDVATEYSAMNSQVIEDQTGSVKFPIMEPAPSKRKSQIEEYLTFHCGPGVQHIAFSSDDIVQTVETLRSAGTDFLVPPSSYYETLVARIGQIEEDVLTLKRFNILVDRDPWGYLMQIFTKPIQGLPTLFLEIIQRHDARGFGGGNIKALFEAVEREQLRRGNL
jgi:4-hydroxyphenylpyruvate dioxygenase